MSDCYVGFKACGCAVAAAVDNPAHRKDTAKSIAAWVKDGLTVERRTVEWVRENLRPCKCEPQRNQELEAAQKRVLERRRG